LSGLLDHLQTAMRDQGHGSSLRYDLDPLKLDTDESVNLGVIVTELVTNAFKYAYPERGGEVRVRLKRLANEHVELVVEDDGVGRSDDEPAKGTGLGTRIVNAMAANMKAEIQYPKQAPGTTARLIFPLQAT
jgi:two-component sensor histidine kinase